MSPRTHKSVVRDRKRLDEGCRVEWHVANGVHPAALHDDLLGETAAPTAEKKLVLAGTTSVIHTLVALTIPVLLTRIV